MHGNTKHAMLIYLRLQMKTKGNLCKLIFDSLNSEKCFMSITIQNRWLCFNLTFKDCPQQRSCKDV